MNLLHTKTPGLIYPYSGDHEQILRGKIFEEKGFVYLLDKQSIQNHLLEKIEKCLQTSYPNQTPDLLGAKKCLTFAKRLVEQR